ncbi:MAG: N-6 DNA methylase [Clostridia bacterium]|nr:N-6 DNA methylase [Clostridia bacterium]
MAKMEVKTDLWVASQLNDCGIKFDAQGSEVKEINDALKSASKRGTGKIGYPEYVAVIHDFVLIIEDKSDTNKHCKYTESGLIDTQTKAVTDYAINGAYFYAKHIAQNSTFKKLFAIGVSGDAKHHKITPVYVDDREGYIELDPVESFTMFNRQNIHEYYLRNVLKEQTPEEKTTAQILKDAADLHEYLRTYGSLKDQDKPLVVSGILLALDEISSGSFSIESLTGDDVDTDGDKIYEAIKKRMKRSNVGPDAKRDKLMSEFAIIRTSARLNAIDNKLGKTPLRYYAEFLKTNVFDNIKYRSASEDFIGRFYGEFMSYSGGDGQSLGIVLTPAHICDLFCELLDVQPNDIVLDPCCGTAGFLVAAMHHMVSAADSDVKKKNIRKKQLHGYELQSNMFAIACTNMILRDDGNSNIQCQDFLKQNPAQVQLKSATVGMMNPPYSQGTKKDPSQYELSFVEHLLDSLTPGARAAVIVPQSSMTGKTKDEQKFKESIMKHHTLEGVITCNTDTFYGVGTNPVIAVFTAHEPHLADKVCKFIDFRDDGYEVRAHVGLVEGDSAKDKKQHLLDVWFGRTEAPSKFCVESTAQSDDEWLHSFYYFNDEIPTESDFEKAIGDYLSFEFSMVMQNREYLFTGGDKDAEA